MHTVLVFITPNSKHLLIFFSFVMSTPIPPGWIGGFPQSNPAFAYPKPDLSSLPMYDNMDNIDKLQRQQKVLWPEFSWQSEPAQADKKRCFQMFAPDISRIGYTNEGRVYSIICPQQGIWIKDILCLNVEVTVTGQRGWVDEPVGKLAADMTVEGKIWFTPRGYQSELVKALWALIEERLGHPFPLSKAQAIRIKTHLPGDAGQPIFPLLYGETDRFTSPPFTNHAAEAYTVGNIDVEIGDIVKTTDPLVDDFNALIMKVFNIGSGNMLLTGNVLSWNVWFTTPELVDQQEWREHAKKWRDSIDAHHGSPEGEGTSPRYADGTYFKAHITTLEVLELLGDLANILTHDLHAQKSEGMLESVSGQSGAPMSEAEMNFRNLLEAHKANAAG